MLQCVAVCCNVLQCVAVCCSVLQGLVLSHLGAQATLPPFAPPCVIGANNRVRVRIHLVRRCPFLRQTLLQCVAVCCSVLQCVVLQCVVY